MPIKVLLLPQPNMIRHEVIGFMMPNLNPDHVSVSRRKKKLPDGAKNSTWLQANLTAADLNLPER